MTENEKRIIEGLVTRDEKVTTDFYSHCNPLLSSVARDVFKEDLDYSKAVSGFYDYLLAEDGAVLREFARKENKNTIYKWLRTTSKSYFEKAKKSAMIDSRAQKALCTEAMDLSVGKEQRKNKEMNISAMLDMVELERDRLVLERIDIERASYDDLAAETGLSKANLYNIHKRALERLKRKAQNALQDADALCAIRCEQYVLDMFGIHKSISELKQISEDKGWLKESGIAIENLNKLPKLFGLSVRTYKSDLKRICAAIDSGKQVLVAVDGGELIGNPFEEKMEDIFIGEIADHCVVVLNYDAEEDKVMLFNPAFGDIPLTVATKTFLDAWHDSDNYTIEISNSKVA